MDVVKLQKMNALASELRKHNFASSSDDAFHQAEEVIEHKPVQEESHSVVAPKVEKHDALYEKRFELLLEQQRSKYEQELGLLRSALGVLSKEVEGLKVSLSKVHEQAPPKPKESQKPLKTEVKEDHPRQGKFSPSDVDIQKMFYFGNKK